jgi:hypothetical protein
MNQLKAPNGNPSNLTPEQWKLVRTPQFKAWFGDWENDPENASKVVDENGEPLVMYHGTQFGYFSEFEKSKIGRNYEKQPFGFYFTNIKTSKQLKGYSAEEYANKKGVSKKPYIFEVFLNVKNPIIQEVYSERPSASIDWEHSELKSALRKSSFTSKKKDGVIAESKWSKVKEVIVVVLESSQIKLADGTNTTFDGSNPDIRFAEGGTMKDKVDELYELATQKFESNGYEVTSGSNSKTDYGHSRYFYVNQNNESEKNSGLGFQVRVSDHSTGDRRILNGEQFIFDIGDVEVVFNKINYWFHPEGYKNVVAVKNKVVTIEVGEKDLLSNDEIISKRVAKSGSRRFQIKRTYKNEGIVPTHIKSGFKLPFKPNNPDIRFAEGGMISNVQQGDALIYKDSEFLDFDSVIYVEGVTENANGTLVSLSNGQRMFLPQVAEKFRIATPSEMNRSEIMGKEIFSKGGNTKRTMKRIKRGGITYGKSHAEGGIPVKNQSTGDMLEVEGGEGIVNKRSMASDKKVKLNGKEMTICEAVSQLNQLEGGVQFSCDDVSDRQFIEAMAKGGELERGTRTEKEHIQVLKDLYAKRITPKEASKRIAKDHLKEDSRYYSKLAKMEGKMADGGKIPNVSHSDEYGKEFTFQGGKFLIVDFPNKEGAWKKGKSYRKTAKHQTFVIKLDNIKTDLDSSLFQKFGKPYFIYDDFWLKFEGSPSRFIDGNSIKMIDKLTSEIDKMEDKMADGGMSEDFNQYIDLYGRSDEYEIVTNLNTLKALQKAGFIEFNERTGERFKVSSDEVKRRHHIPSIRISIDDIKSAVKPRFTFRNNEYFIGYKKVFKNGIEVFKLYVLKKGRNWDKYNLEQKMSQGGEIFDKETEDYLSELTKKFAKGGEVVADKTETINMKDFEGYADQYNGRKNKFFKANDEYQLLVNEGMDVKNNKDLPQDEKDKLLAELREKAREAKTKLNEERKDFVDMREVKSPFYAPQLADGGKISKADSKAIANFELGDYKFKVKHSFLPQKGVDVLLKIYQPRQEVEGVINFKIGVRNLTHYGAWQKKIDNIFKYYGIDSDLYSAKVKSVGKSIDVQILVDKKIIHFSPKISLEILKAFTNKEYYQSIVDGTKEEETPPPTSTPPPTQRKGLPSTDLRVWGAEYEIGDKVKIRWDFSTDLGNGASDVVYDSPENFFEITDKTILSEAKRKENSTGFLYELTNGQSWEGKDLELVSEESVPKSEKEDDWNWRFKTSEELRAELGGDLHAMKDGSVFARSMSYLLGKKIKETTDSLDAIFRINRNTYGGIEVNTEKTFGISNPEHDNEWYISSWMITDKIIEDEVHKYVFDWSKKLFDEIPKKDKFDGAHYLPFSNLINQILKNDGGLSYSDFESFISLCELSNKIERDVVSVVDDTESSEFVKNLLITKYSELLQKVRAKIFEFTNESDFQIDTQVEKVYLYIPYLAKLNTFDKKYIINIK